MVKRSIQEIVRDAERNYLYGPVQIGKYVQYDMHNILEVTDAYLNSKHVSGLTDAKGREKPFFNIVTAAVNIWFRATDIDRKDIIVRPDKAADTTAALLATVILQDWMRREKFGTFLNDWGISLARYGSSVVKFVEKDGKLIPSVVAWNRIICDPIDFDALPRIEKFFKTAGQLRDMATPGHPNYAGYDLDQVDKLIESQVVRKTLDKQQQGTQNNFIELYEVHGLMPQALLSEDADKASDKEWEDHRQQMHVVSFAINEAGEYEDFTLFKGPEKKDPYMITHLIKEDGRTLAIGAVEYLFDAQWMTNDSVKIMRDTLALASRLIFQTADTNYVGRNVLSAIETGDIMVHAENKPLTQINNAKPDIQAMQNFSSQWQELARELTSTPEAMRGITPPSGVPLGSLQIATAQGSSLFEIMTENKGLALEDMLREFVLPYIKKQLNNKDEILTILNDANVKEIDASFVPALAAQKHNDKVKKLLLDAPTDVPLQAEHIPSPYQPDIAEGQVQDLLSKFGNMRSLSPGDITWKDVLKDLEWNLDVGITNESVDKQAMMQSIMELLKIIGTNPAALQDENFKSLFTRALSLTGTMSPIELVVSPPQVPQVPPPAPAESPGLPVNQ